MVQERLSNAVLGRLKELGLPQFLIDFGDFHDKFFQQRWVMFVRDGDQTADVHLVEPHTGKPLVRSPENRQGRPPR